MPETLQVFVERLGAVDLDRGTGGRGADQCEMDARVRRFNHLAPARVLLTEGVEKGMRKAVIAAQDAVLDVVGAELLSAYEVTDTAEEAAEPLGRNRGCPVRSRRE